MKCTIYRSLYAEAELSTEHPASSYGVPVLVILGQAYGADDILPSGLTAAALVQAYLDRTESGCGEWCELSEESERSARRFLNLPEKGASEPLGLIEVTREGIAEWFGGENVNRYQYLVGWYYSDQRSLAALSEVFRDRPEGDTWTRDGVTGVFASAEEALRDFRNAQTN